MSMDLLHPKIFTDIVSLSKIYLLVSCIVAPCFWFVSKLLRLVRKMVCASFKAAHASFMIPPPIKSHPLPLYVKSSNEDSPMSPLPKDAGDDSKDVKDRFVRWMDQSLAIVLTIVPRGEKGRNALPGRYRRKREHLNRRKYRRARKALAKLFSLYNKIKRDNPQHLRSGSSYEKKLWECKLFEQGLDILFLEMQLRAEFRPTPLSNLVRDTWERDDVSEVERVVEEEPTFDHETIAEATEEEATEEIPLRQTRSKRSRGRRELILLQSELGGYWAMSSSEPEQPVRRGSRARRAPDRYSP